MAWLLLCLALAVTTFSDTASAAHAPSNQAGVLLAAEQPAGESQLSSAPDGITSRSQKMVAGVQSVRESRAVALLRSLVAGLSTSLGAAFVLLLRQAPTPFQMAIALSLAAGVMITVSVMELLGPAFGKVYGWQAGIAAFVGFLSFLALRKLVPEPDMISKKDEDVEAEAEHEKGAESSLELKRKQWRLAFLMMAALTAHNFPEGLAIGVSSMQSSSLGAVVMFAIAVHNIPEGIAIALPVLEATNSPSKALLMATLSGLAEPLGALVAVTCLPPGALTGRGMDFMLCIVGGIMTSVACIELMPEAMSQKQPVGVTAGFVSGVAVMLVTHHLA